MTRIPVASPAPGRSSTRWARADPEAEACAGDPRRISWIRLQPFIAIHLACVLVFWVGWSPVALATAAASYLVRMFLVTGFYHRYFSHRTFRTTRAFQFLAGLVCCTVGQRGPLWWAGRHRQHHAYSDGPMDRHSPRLQGFWWSHWGWFLSDGSYKTPWRWVRDLDRYPELVWLDRLEVIPFLAFGGLLFAAGEALKRFAPGLGTSGPQLTVWGFVISTVVLYHAVYTINSIAHRVGRRRFDTTDDSRNNAALALITLGEGWHNNHHHYPASTRQGFYWWEVDLTWYGLKVLSWFGLIWALKSVPAAALARNRIEHR